MARSWLVDSKGFAKKVKNATLSSAYQIKYCGAFRECPNCHHLVDNKDVFPEWTGLPAGVKFDPSDDELLEHLAAQCGSSMPHKFINEFIPTLEGDDGIYYTHPENLPGAKKDGSSVHFFHRVIKAYTTGQRKRRKINHRGSIKDCLRWHKTGKTKPVLVNGVQKGFRKIMVLYGRSKEGSKPNKSKWVLHQYHLGSELDETDREYVVSKIFFQQPKQIEETLIIDDTDSITAKASPRTPKTNPPNPPRPGKSVQCGINVEDKPSPLATQDMEVKDECFLSPQNDNQANIDVADLAWLAGESQDTEISHWSALDDPLLYNGNIHLRYPAPVNDFALDRIHFNSFGCIRNDINPNNVSCGIDDLENLEMDNPPDYHISNLQFSSQDSVFDWIYRL